MNRKYFCLIVIAILLFAIDSLFTAQLQEKKEFRLKDSNKPFSLNTEIQNQSNTFALKTSNKNLFLAGVLSFVVPGAALGQFYKEEFVNGGIRLGISVLVILGFELSGGVSSVTKGNNAIIPLALLYVANWILSIIDASSPPKYAGNTKYRKYRLRF